jgi:hypothetical protein
LPDRVDIVTTNLPAAGIHGRYRTLDTPGPNGWNDHGDPTHRRRQGKTPGPLGHNDHGTPLAGRLPLISNERDAEVARLIDETIAKGNAAADPGDIAGKLQSCLAAVGQAHAADDLQDPKLRYAECYFAARRLTVEGKAGIATDDHPDAPPDAHCKLGGVEYRKPGEFIRPSAPNIPLAAAGLGYQRIGQQPPHAGVEQDRSSYWTEKGRIDGLRDRAASVADLGPYSTMHTIGW